MPVSAGLLVDIERYFDALTRYREGDPTAIITAFARAAFAATANGRALVEDLHRVRAGWQDLVSAPRCQRVAGPTCSCGNPLWSPC